MSTRSWRRSAAFALPVMLASGCLLVAPPEDLPALGASGSGAQGGGGSAGSSVAETGGSGASKMTGGDAGSESSPEGGSPGSAGDAGAAGSGDTGASGGRGAAGGAQGGLGAKGGAGGSSESMGGAGEGGAPGCATNKECVDRTHVEARCRPSDQTCVALKSNECPTVYGPYGDPNAIYVGAFAVLDPENPGASDVSLAEKLAIDEINATGGLPGGPRGAKRPLVLIVCTNDESVEAGAISLGLTHLAEKVQVPALIAMLQGDDLTHALQQEADQNLFYLNPVASLRRLATDSKTTKGLLWTLLGVPSDYASAYHLLLSDLEAQVHSERSLAPTDSIKVLLINTTDAFNDELRLYVFQSLFFNNAAAANNGDNYKEYTFDPTSFPSEAELDEMLAFEPDVVISTAGDIMTAPAGVLPRLEAGWTSTKPRPYYLLSPYNGTSDAKLVIQSVVSTEAMDETNPEPDAARRFLGVNAAPAEDLSLENAFETRYYDAFTDQKPPAAANTDNYYDAVYYLAYAMYAGDSLTGPGIANGMKRLVNGPSFDDGPADMAISKAFAALAQNPSISLNTTLGPSDVFNPVTGVRPVTPGVFCFTFNGSLTLRPNALRYDPTNDKFTGTYPCLDNFPPQ